MKIYRTIKQGRPLPLGATILEGGVNFALFAKHATSITLHLIDPVTESTLATIDLPPNLHRTGDVWHIFIEGLTLPILYLYTLKGPKGAPHHYLPDHFILDPYAKGLKSSTVWGKDSSYNAYGIVMKEDPFDWEGVLPPKIPLKDLVIYELHLRGFTKDASSGCKFPGTYLGLIEKLPYLKELGINAIELMPIFEFYEGEYKKKDPLTNRPLCNYWGYSPLHFFCPMNRYALSSELGAAKKEFQKLVKECHKAGIEVILDVVFNHTGEKKEGQKTLSFLGIDRSTYYLLDGDQDTDYTGCGNTLNVNHPILSSLIVDALRYWAVEMHVDGFRFDLATVLNRDRKGNLLASSPLIDRLSLDPVLAHVKFIAEPWDLGGYQLGGFLPEEVRWSECNGKYRDTLRQFMRGDANMKGAFANALCGSSWIFPARNPQASINFITCHDGFSLYDLVSYNHKHNEQNGEENRDGNPNSLSWNSGSEGETDSTGIQNLRKRQMKNFLLALFLSRGIPLFLMGDEYGHTKNGNNNTWCQDNELSWFSWKTLESNPEFFRFVQRLIEVRKSSPLFTKETFGDAEEILWHGLTPSEPEWESRLPAIACTFGKEPLFYVAFNPSPSGETFTLPPLPEGEHWHLLIDTFAAPPNDLFSEEAAPLIELPNYYVQAYASILLKRKISE